MGLPLIPGTATFLQTRNRNKLASYRPYPKQREFHDAGRSFRERALIAGNQVGKTYCASMEVAMHLTGQYPDWWRGVRYGGPIVAWTGSESNELSREIIQAALLGCEDANEKAPDMGTGAIPGSAIIKLTKRQAGVQDVVDQIIVQHKTGTSRCVLKTYEQKRPKWQGKKVHFVWPDEEPEPDIYSEALTRTQAVPNGRLMATFSPLKGMTTIVKQFLEPKEGDPPRHVTNMTIHDAEHYTDQQRAAAIAAYPAHERKTRALGVPMMGEGRVWPIDEDEIKVNPFEIPRHFARIAGTDFGIDHPAAAAWIAHDRDTDIVYLYDCYQKSGQVPIYHAGTIKQRDPKNYIPVAWPHDGLQRDKGGTGRMIWKQYKDHGARMMRESARIEDDKGGAQGAEATATLMYERMILGTFKVFRHLEPFFEQFRFYHRKDGKIVPTNDDILKATMCGVMELRHARVWMPPRPSRSIYTQPIAS